MISKNNPGSKQVITEQIYKEVNHAMEYWKFIVYVLKQESQKNNLRHEGARTWPACIGSVRKPNHILNQPGWGASLYISQVDMYQVVGIFGLN